MSGRHLINKTSGNISEGDFDITQFLKFFFKNSETLLSCNEKPEDERLWNLSFEIFFSIFQNVNIIYECTYIKEGNTLTEKLGDFGEDEGGGDLYFMSSLIVSSFYVLIINKYFTGKLKKI